MADGGSFLDGARETWKGVKRMPRVAFRLVHHPFPTFGEFWRHVWKVGHDDQRASWFAHYLVCATFSAFIGGVFWAVDGLRFGGEGALTYTEGYFSAAVLAFLFYLYREAGDTRYHELEAKDWDELDHDTDWQGLPVRCR